MEEKETKVEKQTEPKFKPSFRKVIGDWSKKESKDQYTQEEEIFTEIEPFAYDETTGEILNKTNKKILKKVGVRNFYDTIQSHKDEVDMYKILERAIATEDITLIQQRQALFQDIDEMPDNAFELINAIKSLSAEEKTALKSGKDATQTLIDARIKAALLRNNLIAEEPAKEELKNE